MRDLLKQNWLVNRIVEDALEEAIKKYAKGRLVDIGCGEKPYKCLTQNYVAEHVGADHNDTFHDTSKIDLFCTAYDIPVDDEYFETILCTSVLEHLEEPSRAIKEANRVLRKNCYAIYTAPLFWHLHESPRDFYRFTKYGLAHLFEKNGFEVIELNPLSGFAVTFGQELVYFLWYFRKGGRINPLWWLIPIIGMFIQEICYKLNGVDHFDQFTWMYLVVARRL